MPNNFLTNWSMQIGASLETILFSFALADRINSMRGSLAKLNVQQGVDNLRRIPTVVDAIRDRGLKVHGLLYRLSNGHLEQIDTAEDEKASECRQSTFELK